MRDSDNHEVSQLNELKGDTGALTFTAHYDLAGDIIMVEQMPIYGGFAGGLEETTIVDVRHASELVRHVRRDLAPRRSGTHAVGHHDDQGGPGHRGSRQPCHRGSPAPPADGQPVLHPGRSLHGDVPAGDGGTGHHRHRQRPRAHVAAWPPPRASSSTRRPAWRRASWASAPTPSPACRSTQVNEILDALVASYEGDYKTAPEGKPYEECYDTVKVVPTDEYLGSTTRPSRP